jgi:hypothetical protein
LIPPFCSSLELVDAVPTEPVTAELLAESQHYFNYAVRCLTRCNTSIHPNPQAVHVGV